MVILVWMICIYGFGERLDFYGGLLVFCGLMIDNGLYCMDLVVYGRVLILSNEWLIKLELDWMNVVDI